MKEENKINKLSDKSFRTQLRSDPKQHVGKLFGNNNNLQDIEIVVKTNTKNTVYVVFPSSTMDMDMAMLNSINAAGTTFTASTASSAGTATSSLSSVSSVGTAGSLVHDKS